MAKASTNRVRNAASIKKRRKSACFVYLLGTSDKDRTLTYVGWTLDLDRRLAQHNGGKGGARSTRGRTWTLLHVERFATRQEAMSREWYLKRDRPFRKLLLSRFRRSLHSAASS
jgi:putative endonuclease